MQKIKRNGNIFSRQFQGRNRKKTKNINTGAASVHLQYSLEKKNDG